MGCGISTFDTEDGLAGPTCEFNPLHKNNVHPIDHQVDFDNSHGRKSISSPAKDKVTKQIRTRQVMCSEDPTEEKEPRKEKVMSAGKVGQEDQEGLRKEEVEEDGRRINKEEEREICHKREDSLIGPGSPSFKEYCMDSSTSCGCSNDGRNGDAAKSDKKPQKELGPLESNELVYGTQIGKKGQRKGRGFRSVLLHKGRRMASRS
ncbi:uncharacterized protein LOC121252097 [Juglans microcarpa x Juglans regia]|uniref:uncharacterized protein LOC121252097 n=1 Tax=Juglans microcarpa x Juglans regia TaxID=2249226 RepID=UPI001B7E491C|nr:uncharacterized protein LOC121252097 [Juglans microcarpa x Juglans regia]